MACRVRTWAPIQLRISLLSRSLLAIEIDAVNSAVNHQYTFMPNPFSTTKALDIVPKMVSAAARVVRSSLSHDLKKACIKPNPGVESRRIFWIEVPVPAAALARATVEAMEMNLFSPRCGVAEEIRTANGGREVLLHLKYERSEGMVVAFKHVEGG